MATDGATLDYFLNTLMALSTVCPTESFGHADGSSRSPLNFTIKSPAWEGGYTRVRYSFQISQDAIQMHTSKVDTSRAKVLSGNQKELQVECPLLLKMNG